MFLFKILLYPIFMILYAVVCLRNFVYDRGIFRSIEPNIPTICIGNIRVGGTGKTPFVDMLLDALNFRRSVALLSRGYGRDSKGYAVCRDNSKSCEVGDEPLMLSKLHPDVFVAVCEDRLKGIKNIQRDFSDVGLVVLDDAMQHRRVKPLKTIMLTEYHRPFFEDYLFPIGWLRDIRCSAKRADIIVVTKTPCTATDSDMDVFADKVRRYCPNVFFSISLSHLPQSLLDSSIKLESGSRVVVMSAIASAKKFEQNIAKTHSVVGSYGFRDHHKFTCKEVCRIIKFAKERDAVVVMTAKDSIKVEQIEGISSDDKKLLYHQHISFKILEYNGNSLSELINSLNLESV